MSSVPTPSVPSSNITRRATMALQGLALNTLFPPPPRLPGDMMAALAKLDRVRL